VRPSLETANEISFAGEAAHGFKAVRQARLLEPDAVPMHVRMPRLDGMKPRAGLHDHDRGDRARRNFRAELTVCEPR